ncbi:MAG: helix-turn-helix transcriptional regulator [Dehalococcoidales bacterium]|nr:helix-turn-helix transcriptional regulator [Dehalococcoidales bacterium]
MKNRLKVFRAMHDLTQEELANKLGVTRQTVVSLEIGKYDPSIGLAFRLAKLFNVRIEDIFEYEGTPGEYRGLPPTSRSQPT